MEMASSINANPETPLSPPQPRTLVRQNNLRNPLPLSPSQESEVRQLYHKRARDRCQPVIKSFAECAAGRTISVAWKCKDKQMAMNSCIMQYATKADEDAAREEWFAGLMARRKEKEDAVAKNQEVKVRVLEMARVVKERDKEEAEKKRLELEEGKKVKSGSWWR